MRARAVVTLAILVVAMALLGGCPKGERRELVVFAAASTAGALDEVARAYQRKTGTAVRVTFGGSSELARQIESGADVDVFLSADTSKMDRLETLGFVRGSDRRALLSNTLVVVVPVGAETIVASPTDLMTIGSIATGDPSSVPIGLYAEAWLTAEGVWAGVAPHVVPTVDVRAALAAVESESVVAAIVYRTDALASPRVRIVYEAKGGSAPKIVYPLAVLAAAKHGQTRAFVDFCAGPEARPIFSRYGFLAP